MTDNDVFSTSHNAIILQYDSCCFKKLSCDGILHFVPSLIIMRWHLFGHES